MTYNRGITQEVYEKWIEDNFKSFVTIKDAVNEKSLPEIEKVVFNCPATVVLWKDGTKTVVKCQEGDEYSKETGLAMCIAKRAFGNKGRYNYVFKKWCK